MSMQCPDCKLLTMQRVLHDETEELDTGRGVIAVRCEKVPVDRCTPVLPDHQRPRRRRPQERRPLPRPAGFHQGEVAVYLKEVTDRVAEISAASDEPECSHSMTDDLYIDVLRAISTGQCKDTPPEDFALEALKVEGLGLTRWYS